MTNPRPEKHIINLEKFENRIREDERRKINEGKETPKEIESVAFVKYKKALLQSLSSSEVRLTLLREIDKRLGIGVIR